MRESSFKSTVLQFAEANGLTFPCRRSSKDFKLEGEAQTVFRRIISLALWFALLLAGAGVFPHSFQVIAQEKPAQEKPAKQKPAQQKTAPEKPPKDKATQGKTITAEQVAETVVYLNGTREGLSHVRHSGVERGIIKRNNSAGKVEEVTYERRFIQGGTMDKDRIRLEQKMPTAEYSLVFSGGQVWGIINEAIFTPRQEASQDFISRQWHGLDAILRYKENGSTLGYVGREKQKGVDQFIVDVTDKEQHKTRFYVSAKTGRVLALEYEEAGVAGKFTRRFYDYRVAQGTLVPFRSLLFNDDKQVEETQILTVTYGLKVDEAQFQNPDAPATSTAATP